VDLLSHLDLLVNPCLVCDSLSHGCRAVSDGSVKYNDRGVYGWILSSDVGEQLVCGMGPARGYQPTPYRAKGVGILSLLRFLIRLAEYACKFDQ
jgi:hypothetical protein